MTGAGIISAIGVGKEATLQALINEASGVGAMRHLDSEHSELPVGEVKMSNARMLHILKVSYPIDELRTVLLGIFAAKEAVDDARLDAAELRRTAFISGTTVGGMDKTERHFKSVFNANAQTPDSAELKYNDSGCSTNLIADHIGRFQMVTTPSTACSSAANAIILGANLIKSGIVDIAVAGGAEALTKFHLNGFNSLMILDKERCRPFDKNRTGINLGEGAAYIVLESAASAKRRSAKVLAQLAGYGNACDAFHQTATSENGDGAYFAMTKALAMAGLSPCDIDYINSHGTGTPNNDICELAAMERIWPGGLPTFSSTKPLTGHTTSASGSIETVISLLCMAQGIMPASLGASEPMKGDVMPLTQTVKGVNLKHVMNNSFGFGGNDSTLIFSAYDGARG